VWLRVGDVALKYGVDVFKRWLRSKRIEVSFSMGFENFGCMALYSNCQAPGIFGL